jgi:hypothetical protein
MLKGLEAATQLDLELEQKWLRATPAYTLIGAIRSVDACGFSKHYIRCCRPSTKLVQTYLGKHFAKTLFLPMQSCACLNIP